MPGMVVDFSVRNVSKFVHTDTDAVLPGGGPLQVAVDAPDTADTNLFLGGVKLTWDTFGGALTHVFRANRNTFDQTTNTRSGGFSENLSEDSTSSAISVPIGLRRRVSCRPSIR